MGQIQLYQELASHVDQSLDFVKEQLVNGIGGEGAMSKQEAMDVVRDVLSLKKARLSLALGKGDVVAPM